MKQDWEIKKLGEVCLSLEDGDWIEKKNQSSAGIRLIQTGNIGCGFYKDKIDKAKYISEDTFNTLRCTEVIAGDILISRLPEPVGRACIVPKLRTKCITAVDCSIVKLNPNLILASWFIYYTQSADYTAKVVSECSGTTRDRISRKKLSVITVPIPPLDEQERIVEILDREFERIDALKANAEQNLQHAKDLFQSALKQELQPQEGWETKTIGEIAELKGGKRVPKGYKLEIEPTGYPYIRVADFNDNGTVDLDDIHYISEKVYEGIKRYTITTNDVYISIAGTIGKSGIIPEDLNGANLTENACRLVFKEEVDKKYIYYCTISSDFKEQIAKLTMQAAQPKLALTRLATATLNLPSVGTQREIVARIDILNERCKALEENYKKTIALCDDMKQALLRKAFNGEL